MPRSADEKKRSARKYGRRRAVLEAERSAKSFDAMAKRLLRDLKKAGADAATIGRLTKNVETVTDVTRRRAAVWAIVDALESLESQHENGR